jgi:hypothetical protein
LHRAKGSEGSALPGTITRAPAWASKLPQARTAERRPHSSTTRSLNGVVKVIGDSSNGRHGSRHFAAWRSRNGFRKSPDRMEGWDRSY